MQFESCTQLVNSTTNNESYPISAMLELITECLCIDWLLQYQKTRFEPGWRDGCLEDEDCCPVLQWVEQNRGMMGVMKQWEEPKDSFTFMYHETPHPLCAHPLSPVLCHLCIITQPPSLPLLVSYQTDGFFHMAFTPPSAPSFSPSRSISLMLCGSVGCCVCS